VGDQTPPCRVVLIGMMGSGKSTIGKLLARETGWPYIDNDELLEMLRGETAKSLLAHEGVTELREGEADALRIGLKQEPPCIVGAPAGTILESDIRRQLKRDALVVWLDARAETLARRARGAAHRPWLDADPLAWMTKTLAERAPLYESVTDLKVSTDDFSPSDAASHVAKWLKARCR
jgi:shikimate kinase